MTHLLASPLRTVRTRLGISQASLARYLGISRALVEHAEAGRRTLPVRAARKLDALLAALPPATDEAPTPLAPDTPPTALAPPLATPLRRRLRHCRHEAARLRHQLADWQARAATARQCLHVVPPLLAALPPVTPVTPTVGTAATPAAAIAEHERLWLELLAADATAALALYGAPAQALLAVRLVGLDAEAAAIDRLLNPPGTPPAPVGPS